MNIAIIFAGGVGLRMKNVHTTPKQFVEVEGKTILAYTLEHFQKHPDIDKIYIAMLKDHISFTQELVKKHNITKVAAIVPGGETGQGSIYNALDKALSENSPGDIVLIHDGVRPVLTADVISQNIQGVKDFGTAVTAMPCTETIVISKDGKTQHGVPLRKELHRAQAPQSFYLGDIITAHKEIKKTHPNYEDMVDSCTIYHTLGKKVNLVPGNFVNIKITNPEDIHLFKALIGYYKYALKEQIPQDINI